MHELTFVPNKIVSGYVQGLKLMLARPTRLVENSQRIDWIGSDLGSGILDQVGRSGVPLITSNK